MKMMFASAIILLFIIRGAAVADNWSSEDKPENYSKKSPGIEERQYTRVISKEEIERSGAVVLGEVLSWIAGLEVIDTGYLGAEKTVAFEGFPADRLLYILDGEVINDPYGSAFDLNMIPLSAVERVEVVRHPSFLDRDSHAAGGVVRITTKRFEGGSPFSRLTLSGGSLGTSIISGEFRRGLFDEAVGISLVFDRFSSDLVRDEGDYKTFKYHLRVDEEHWDRVDLDFSITGTNASSELIDEDGDGTSSTELDRGFQNVNVAVSIDPDGTLPIEFSAFHNINRSDNLDLETPFSVGERRGDRKGARVEGRYTGMRGIEMVFGTEEEILSTNGDTERKIFSLFTGGGFKTDLFPEIELMGRWERASSLLSGWSGGLTASQPLGEESSLFASFLEARHVPSLEDLDLSRSSLNLEKERVIETGLSYRFKVLRNSLTWFSRWSRGGIEGSDPNPDEELKEYGWRIVSRARVGETLSCSMGYQRIDVQEFPAGGVEQDIPKHYLTGTVDVNDSFKDDVLGYSFHLSGVMVRGRGQVSSPQNGDRNYQFIDMNVGFRFVDVTFFYTIRNVFDSRFEIIRGFVMPGRINRFGFTWDFYD